MCIRDSYLGDLSDKLAWMLLNYDELSSQHATALKAHVASFQWPEVAANYDSMLKTALAEFS